MFTIPAFPEVGLLAVVFCWGMTLFILLSVKKNKTISYLFAISTFTASIWIGVNTVILPQIRSDLFDIVKVSFFSGYLTLVFIWIFIFHFKSETAFYKKFKLINYIVLSFSILMNFIVITTNLIITETYYVNDSLILKFGTLYPLASIYSLSLFVGIIFIIFYKFKNSKGLDRVQLQFFLIGFGITAGISMITNVFYPLISVDSNSSRIGPLAVIIYLVLTTYAIVRYKFLDLRILIGRITYFGTLAFLTYCSFYLVTNLNIILFGSIYEFGSYFFGIIMSVGFVLFFNWFNRFVLNQVNSRLISPNYDPNEVVSEFNNHISTVLDYRVIAEYTLDTLAKTIRSSGDCIYLFPEINKDTGVEDIKKDLEVVITDNKEHLVVDEVINAINIWKIVGKFPIILDEYQIELPKIFVNLQKEMDTLLQAMEKAKVKLLIPLGQSGSVMGILLIGSKNGENPYNSIEKKFLNSIADIMGLALARAMLYKEVQEFNKTLQKKVEDATQKIQEQNSKLQETLRFERDMLDVIGHELRTPLGTARNAILIIDGFLKKDSLPEKEKLSEVVSIAVENIRREVQLLETILASTKIDNAKLDMAMEKVDAKDVLEDSFTTYHDDAQKKSLKLEKILPEGELFCLADRLRIQQVIDNLVSNAIKYTFNGGVTISVEQEKEFVKFSVQDTGLGIPEKEIPNLGKKFYRINNYLSSKGKIGGREIVRPGGTGIGLYVVFELVKAMNGRVEIKSKEGEGSTFSFYIPVYKQEENFEFKMKEVPKRLNFDLGKKE